MKYATKFDCKYKDSKSCEITQDSCDMKCDSHPCDLCINKDNKEICKNCLTTNEEEA